MYSTRLPGSAQWGHNDRVPRGGLPGLRLYSHNEHWTRSHGSRRRDCALYLSAPVRNLVTPLPNHLPHRKRYGNGKNRDRGHRREAVRESKKIEPFTHETAKKVNYLKAITFFQSHVQIVCRQECREFRSFLFRFCGQLQRPLESREMSVIRFKKDGLIKLPLHKLRNWN